MLNRYSAGEAPGSSLRKPLHPVQAEGRKGIPLTLAVASLATLALDQLSKAAVRIYLPQDKEGISFSFLTLRQVRNPGTAFGIVQGRSWTLFLASVAVFAVLLLV